MAYSECSDPLDALHRFVPTPLRAVFDVGQTRVVVQTNDFSLLPELPLATINNESDKCVFEWKIVRDYDARGVLEEPMLMTSGKLLTVAMGTACLVGLDYERRQLLGFIGAEVDARTFQHVLLPLFRRLTNERSHSSFRGGHESTVNA
ncbi:MAG TPA: hypothetical protein VK525_12305 [Candidatus Saccharimonadales bacterium]|jgi:hypothetical protein|nr:hypothetical protein [Candidatus Saccharimonadales bacterium]